MHNLWKTKFLKEADLYWICKRNTVKICQNQHADFLRFLLRQIRLKIKKDKELVPRSHFFGKNFDVIFFFFFFCNFTCTGRISLIDDVYFTSYSVQCTSWFMAKLLKSWNKKLFSSEKSKKSKKEKSTLFRLKNKLAKTYRTPSSLAIHWYAILSEILCSCNP